MKNSPKELLKKIRRIAIHSTHLAEDMLQGKYRSIFHGTGMEFEDVRPFVNGDEMRAIDWNVTARMHEPYIKSFREEREMTVTIAIDLSSSTCFGSIEASKREIMTEIAGTLAFSAIHNHDKVALLLFTDRVEKYLPAKHGKRHVMRLLREMMGACPEGVNTDFVPPLKYLAKVLPRSGIVFFLSDFLAELPQKQLRLLAKKHDLIALSVTDPKERQLPAIPWLKLKNLEGGQTGWMRSDRDIFAKEYEMRDADLRDTINKCGASFIEISTDENYLLPLTRFFRKRMERQR